MLLYKFEGLPYRGLEEKELEEAYKEINMLIERYNMKDILKNHEEIVKALYPSMPSYSEIENAMTFLLENNLGEVFEFTPTSANFEGVQAEMNKTLETFNKVKEARATLLKWLTARD